MTYEFDPTCDDIIQAVRALNYWAHVTARDPENDAAEHEYRLWKYRFNLLSNEGKK